MFFGAATAERAGGHDAEGGLLVVAVMLLVGLAIVGILLVIGVMTAFVYPLIVDRGLKAIPAIKTSLAAGRAMMDSDLSAEEIARKAMAIAADICVYTNGNLTLEQI